MLGVAAALVVVAAGAGWAFTVILSPAPGVPTTAGYTLVSAVEGDVGAHLTLNVAASWSLSPVGTNESAGVVTTVDLQNGQLVNAGARLYSVDLRPVVVAQGAVPAYRSIVAGDFGADVAELQSMLSTLGFYTESADGTAGESTTAAVERWQRSLGVDATGEVTLGDLIFVPALPARLGLATDIVHRGATLAGGEAVLQGLGEPPIFTLPVSDAQSAVISTGTRVIIDDGAGDSWLAVAGVHSEAQTGTAVIALEAPAEGSSTGSATSSATGSPPGSATDSAPDSATGSATGSAPDSTPSSTADPGTTVRADSICGQQCDRVPPEGQTLFTSRVVTVETVHGTVIPSAALRTDAAQQVSVIDSAGAVHAVRVTAESQGLSVVTGIDAGLAVEVPVYSALPEPPEPGEPPVPVSGTVYPTSTGSP